MKKYAFITVVFLLLNVTSAQATTIQRHPVAEKEIVCRCLGTYTRFQYEISQGSPINIKVIASSSNEVCDEHHSQELEKWPSGTDYPDGIIRIGVLGFSSADKNVNLEECLRGEEFEIRGFFYPEETIIDLRRINRPLE